MATNLKDLKVGDPVMFVTGGYTSGLRRDVVSKVGKLHLTVGSTKYSIANGYAAGMLYSGDRLEVFDKERWGLWVLHCNDALTRRHLEYFNWRAASMDLVNAVYDIIQKDLNNGK